MLKKQWQRISSSPLARELLVFGAIYLFLALINLRVKMFLTAAWYDGILERNHELLLAFQYANPEQSRLLQFCIPELFRRLLGLSIPHAYILQRWLFVFLAFLCFHFYLKKWFDSRLAFAGVLILAASMPLSYFNHLQESSPLLLLTFLLALWAIRERRTFWYAVVLTVGAFNNETMLFLPAVFVFYNFKGLGFRQLIRLVLTTLGSCLPAYLVVGTIRYINRDRPQLGDLFWHWPDNIRGIWRHLRTFPLDYWRAEYVYFVFIFGVFWLYAFLRYSKKPLFLRRAALTIPLFIVPHLLATIIAEVRLMLPLSFIVIPMALFYLFPPASDETASSQSPEAE